MSLTFGSLFAGIGGLDLGLERAGMKCIWQVEIDPYARRVLEKHWPNVRRWDDVRTFPPGPADGWECDLIAGGFPCQDISLAGKGAGVDGKKSGLWREFVRVIHVVGPRLVLMENSPALANRGLSRVLGALAGMGFDAEWAVLPATAFGACHIRARMFIVAHRQRGGWDRVHERQQEGRLAADPGNGRPDGAGRATASDSQRPDADPSGARREDGAGQPDPRGREAVEPERLRRHVPHPDRPGRAVGQEPLLLVQQPAAVGSGWWASEPGIRRVVDGFPGRVDRLRCLGNAVVPQVAEWIGRRILASLEAA